jgi:hypothetical protein
MLLAASSASLGPAHASLTQEPAGHVRAWRADWPKTDFSRHAAPLQEIESVVPKDAIPSIDDPQFVTVADVRREEAIGPARARDRADRALTLSERDPVISVEINGDARAYPLRIMMYHEIVNDVVGGAPVVVTYCPLCNTGLVFDRVIDGAPTEFGVSGKLRKSSLIMYDRRTESWWQQYTGEAIVGAMSGRKLERRVTRLESFKSFARRFPEGRVLIPNDPGAAPYGRNPYLSYDSERRPFLYRGGLPKGIEPLARVVVVGDTAYSLALLAREGEIIDGDIRLSWEKGQASAVDAARVSKGREVGDVVVQRKGVDGEWRDIAHDVVFAFVFHAFTPEGEWRM